MKQKLPVLTKCLSIFFLCFMVGQTSLLANFRQNEVKIKVDFENATVEEVFNEIESKTDFTFSFDREILDPSVRITFRGKTQVTKLLKIVSRDARLEFRRINQNIHVRKPSVPAPEITDPEEIVMDRTISGTVTDENNEPLPGASVYLEGTTLGTVTDVNGNYSVSVPDQGGVLIVSFVGYTSERIVIGAQNVINVTLTPDIQALTEVVVIGYGTREKKDVVGAISTIGTEDIQQAIGLTPEMAMQGRMSGVFVSNPGGDPTERPEIRIRGIGSFNNNDPLYVIDGVPVTEFGSVPVSGVDADRAQDIRGNINIMNLINPADIESISVLKDASAAAIYGARAANGVILITTKSGQAGKPKINFNAQYGVKNVTETYDVLNTQQYTALLQEAYTNAGISLSTNPTIDPTSPLFLGNSDTYDWQEEILNDNAVSQNYGVNVSGGNDYSNYYVGLSYSQEEAALKFNDTERYTVTLNSDHKVTPWLKVGQTARLAYMDVLENRSGGEFNDLARVPAWQPVYLPNGEPAPILDRVDDGSGGLEDSLFYGPLTGRNTFGVAQQQRFSTEFWRFLGSAYVEIEPIENLKIRGGVSYDWNLNQRYQYIDFDRRFYRTGGTNRVGDAFSQRDSRNTNLLKEITLNYNRSFGDHNVDILLNASNQISLATGFAVETDDIPFSDEEEFIFVADGAGESTGWREETGLVGYVGRISYSYQDRYYLDVAVRRDASSNFAEDFRWGTFPSISGAWRLSSESFMSDITFINDLKLRGGWGQLGNQNVTPFSYLAIINANPRYSTGSGNGDSRGVLNPGAFVGNFPIENLTWETTTTTSIGLEGVVLNGMLQFEVEYYNRKTSDILQNVELPLVTGADGEVPFNIGEMSNQGIELNLNASRSFGDWTVNVGGNLTTVKNEVLKRYEGVAATDGSERIEEGQSFRYIYGYKTDGIYQTPGEVEEDNGQYRDPLNIAPGDVRFLNINTSSPDGGILPGPDSLLNEADRTFLGKTIPGYYYGFNFGVNYRNFDLTLFFRGVGDVQRVNNIREVVESMSTEHNQLATTLNRWTPENPSNTMPRAVLRDPAGNNRISDRWVEDAGFLRLQTVRLGYNLPNSLTGKIGASSFRVFAGFDNLFVISDYSGVDPENDQNPPPRTFLVGLTASF